MDDKIAYDKIPVADLGDWVAGESIPVIVYGVHAVVAAGSAADIELQADTTSGAEWIKITTAAGTESFTLFEQGIAFPNGVAVDSDTPGDLTYVTVFYTRI